MCIIRQALIYDHPSMVLRLMPKKQITLTHTRRKIIRTKVLEYLLGCNFLQQIKCSPPEDIETHVQKCTLQMKYFSSLLKETLIFIKFILVSLHKNYLDIFAGPSLNRIHHFIFISYPKVMKVSLEFLYFKLYLITCNLKKDQQTVITN